MEKDHMRVKAYTGAIESIKQIKTPIKSGFDLRGIKGVGKSVIEKVQEYFRNGKFREVSNAFGISD